MKLSRRDWLKLATARRSPPAAPASAASSRRRSRRLVRQTRSSCSSSCAAATTPRTWSIPVGSDFYYAVAADHRAPQAGSRQSGGGNLARPAERRADVGLHPALKDTMLPLWQKGQLAFVPFAGTDDLTRSHFETQDSVESGMPVVGAGRRRTPTAQDSSTASPHRSTARRPPCPSPTACPWP